MSPPNAPKLGGASVTAHGESSRPPLTSRCSRSPFGEKTSTKPLPGRAGVVALAGPLLGARDVELAADVVDPERREAGREGRVGEAVDEVEVIVEDVDPSEAEARCVDELAVRSGHEGEALVVGTDVAGSVRGRRVVDGNHGVRVVDVRIPAGDRAVFGREEE